MVSYNYLLAILIPSLTRRAPMLKRLLDSIPEYPNVIVLTEVDNGKLTTGTKRNTLLFRAKQVGAEYVVFIDDDDHVTDTYLPMILRALKEKPDAVGISGWMTWAGKDRQDWEISVRHEYTDAKVMLRPINHLCPIRTEIALQAKFPSKSFREDYEYSMRLKRLGLIKKEVFITEQIYWYDYRNAKPQGFP